MIRVNPLFIRVNHFTKKFIVGVISLLIIGTPILYLTLINANKTQAAWFDDNWAYRKAVNIATHTATESNVYINLTGANDIDTSDTGRFQTDCGDLRFTDAGGKLLQYYVVSGCGTVDTVVHVFFQTMPAGAQTVYYYYGNPTVQNGGNAADFATEASSYTFTTIGSEEKTPGPLVYLKFDDGTGTNTQDSTTNNLDGTITGPTWQTEDQCVSGKCLWFDGVNDYVYAADNAILDNASSALTVGAWIKPNSYDASNWDIIATKWKDGAPASYSWHFSLHQGKLSIFISSDGTTAGSELAVDSSVIETNKWSYVVFTVDTATDEVKLYKNGVQVGSTGSYTAASIPNSSAQLRIGTKEGADEGSFPFPGFIDDVKIYPYARSAAQIKTDYDSRGSIKGASTDLGSNFQNNPGALNNGLVSYWKMDESSWTNDCTATSVTDSSGNSNNGKACPATTGPTGGAAGKFGNAGSFDGSDDYISIANATSLQPLTSNWSVGLWLYRTGAGAGDFPQIIGSRPWTSSTDKGWSVAWDSANNKICGHFADGSTGFDVNTGNSCSSSTTTLNSWEHWVIVFDRSNGKLNYYKNGTLDISQSPTGGYPPGSINQTNAIYIAREIEGANNRKLAASLDEIRMYNRALSAAEVAALYNFAPGPVGYWKMDDNQGTSALDSSSNGFTGTLTNGPSWTQGKFGAGLSFDGSNDYVEVTRNTTLEPTTAITVATWMKGSSQGYVRLVSHGGTLNGYELIALSGGTIEFNLGINSTEVNINSNGSVTDNNWHYIVGTWDGSTVRMYVDGILQTSTATATGTITHGPNPVRFGVSEGGLGFLNGSLDDIKIYSYARTSKQIVEDMNAGHPAVGSPVGSAVGHWKFDEGADNTCSGGTNDACNSGSQGSTLDGAGSGFSSPATSTSGWTNSGKFGKALLFDGSNDYVNIPNTGSGLTSGDLSVSGWIYPTTIPTGANDAVIVDLAGTSTSERIYVAIQTGANSGKLTCNGYDGTVRGVYNTGPTLSANTWYHFTCIVDSSGNYTLYLNGVSRATSSSTNVSATTPTMAIGSLSSGAGGPGRYFTGTIDEVKVYNYALTADEVKIDMNRSSSQVLGSISDKSTPGSNFAAGQEYCVPGDTSTSCAAPVGEWKFDEKTGTSARDTSGNAFTGTLTSSPKWTSGKIGSGVIVNSTDQSYITMGNINKTIRTLSVWFKPNSTVNASSAGGMNNFIVFVDGSGHNADIWLQGGPVTGNCTNEVMGIMDTLNGYRTCSSSITSISPVWNHFVMVWNTSTSNYDMYLNGQLQTVTKGTAAAHVGLITASAFKMSQRGALPEFSDGWGDFTIDQLRIYDYARSAAQIAWDYNRGAPVGHWKFDECQGTTAYDDSRNANGTTNGNNGTITVGGAPNTAVGTCTGSANTMWKDGATGKYNSSLDFDGTDDYISVGSNSILNLSTYTTSFWMKATNASDTSVIEQPFTKTTNAATAASNYVFSWRHTSSTFQKACAHSTSGTFGSQAAKITSTMNTGTWYHITCTYDGTNIKAYLNGNLEATTPASAPDTGNQPLYIGSGYSNGLTAYFNGQLDDTQIYNYALTATQVKSLYNQGGAVRFGPITGSP